MKVVSERNHTCIVGCARNEVKKVMFDCKKRVHEELKRSPTSSEQSITKVKDTGMIL